MNINEQNLKEIRDILGKYNYDYIKTYYYNVAIKKQVEYKIFINRKEEYLFRIFKNVFENYPDEIPNEEKGFKLYGIFCNEAILNNNINLEGKKVLIVNGNLENNDEINNILNFIDSLCKFNNCNKENINLWFSYSAIDLETERLSSYIKHIIYNDNTKTNSTYLTEMILSLNCGYTNNYDIYKTDNATVPILSRLESPNIYENKSFIFSKKEISGKILFTNDILNLDEYSIKSCIRFYEKNNQTVIIPTIVLPKIYKQNSSANCIKLLSQLQLEIPNKEASDAYIYNYTTKQISSLLIQKFLEKIGIENVNIEDYKIYNADINGILTFPNSAIKKVILPNDTNYNYNYIKKIENYKQNIIDLVTKINEESMEEIIHEKFEKCNNEEIMSFLINLVDNECLKFNQVNVRREEYFEYNTIEKDSQLYLAFYELYNKVFNYFYEFARLTLECDYTQYLQFAEYFDNKRRTNDFTTFVKIINESDILDLYKDIYSILLERLNNKINNTRYISENIVDEVLEYQQNVYTPTPTLKLSP